MRPLRHLCERVAPVGPETTVGEACARFAADPKLRLLPVIQGARAWGLLSRDALLASASRSDAHRLTLSEVPLVPVCVVDAGETLSTAREALLARAEAGVMQGFVVVEEGEYLGFGDGLTLLRAGPEALHGWIDGVRREVGGPLEGLLAIAALMQRQPLSLDGAGHLRAMVAAARSALAYVSDLSLALGPGLGPELVLQPASLPELLDEVDVGWQVQAALRGVRLMASCRADSGLRALVDGERFKQVLNGLVNEAFEQGAGGVVEAQLVAERRDEELAVCVRVRHATSGPADAAAFLPGSPQMAVIAAMNGTLRREANQGAGVTTVFEVVLPIARESAALAATEPSMSALGHILVVDDNATNRLVAEALCESFGFTCETAESGEEALEAAGQRAFDLILMDIRMPGMDGVEATRAIRGLPGPVARTPILALTANADPEQAAGYRAAGMRAVVEKPIKPEALFRAISDALYGGAAKRPEAKPAAAA